MASAVMAAVTGGSGGGAMWGGTAPLSLDGDAKREGKRRRAAAGR